MKLFSRQAMSTEAMNTEPTRTPSRPTRASATLTPTPKPTRFLLTSVIGIAGLLGSLLASVAALAVLHPTAAQAQTTFTPSVTITVPTGTTYNNIGFTVSFEKATDAHMGCSDSIADLTYTSTATGTT